MQQVQTCGEVVKRDGKETLDVRVWDKKRTKWERHRGNLRLRLRWPTGQHGVADLCERLHPVRHKPRIFKDASDILQTGRHEAVVRGEGRAGRAKRPDGPEF
jgi:hypothetical protein